MSKKKKEKEASPESTKEMFCGFPLTNNVNMDIDWTTTYVQHN